jgi:hypothetical protein
MRGNKYLLLAFVLAASMLAPAALATNITAASHGGNPLGFIAGIPSGWYAANNITTSVSGNLSSMTMFTWCSTPGNAAFVVWNDSAGAPGAEIERTPVSCASDANATAYFSGTTWLPAGDYWIGMTSNASIWQMNLENAVSYGKLYSGPSAGSLGLYTFGNGTVVFELNVSVTEFCYQESANVSTGCGGLDTGSYVFSPWKGYEYGDWVDTSNVIDGDWNTYGSDTEGTGSGILLINYTKPAGATSDSLWQVKDGNGTDNLTIPYDCLSYDPNTLQLRIVSDELESRVHWMCWDGDWEVLREEFDSSDVYEEAMSWLVGEPYLSATFNFSSVSFGLLSAETTNNPAPGLLDGAYNISVDTNADYKIMAMGEEFWDDGNGHTISYSLAQLSIAADADAGSLSTGESMAVSDIDELVRTDIPHTDTVYYLGFWVSIPGGQYAGNYTYTVTMTVSNV